MLLGTACILRNPYAPRDRLHSKESLCAQRGKPPSELQGVLYFKSLPDKQRLRRRLRSSNKNNASCLETWDERRTRFFSTAAEFPSIARTVITSSILETKYHSARGPNPIPHVHVPPPPL